MKVAVLLGIGLLILARLTDAHPATCAGRAADPAVQQSKCAKLEQRLRDVRSKMRGGYGAKEGERLKARQRQLNGQRRTQKCG
jgi:hypothetical protein